MYFVQILSLTSADDFVSWLDGKSRLAFNDSQEFHEWLAGQNVFPLEIYINGMTMRFDNQNELRFFTLGVEVMLSFLRNNE